MWLTGWLTLEGALLWLADWLADWLTDTRGVLTSTATSMAAVGSIWLCGWVVYAHCSLLLIGERERADGCAGSCSSVTVDN